ncbi:enoyl-CoA hydratase/isomerase family protein [Asanoa sp. WMMD1127]|uniref:enoyl-CoA hydratase/isomerase family protein n=1 Tax=Asanoa sp. WMMD1127 TaxID=3016107 RepID=UPI0024180940|nr:enoyl-CoA hydratase/isomerase family protein [Asanoa sp. WMMD1127]MDG4824821.1 enoyl-CoA hydratase/isomerase family protein [Asanoa sp. WMMD1127]
MISVEERGAVSVVRIENGPVNVLDLETLRELTSTLAGLERAPALVVTGAGRAFSAGVDLKRLVEGGETYTREFLLALGGVFQAVFDHPRPLVAAVNGHAIAGGCVIAAGCDYRFMSAGTIGVTELLVGVPFPGAALEAIRFVLGPRTASLVLTGRTLAPADAQAVGLVDEVVAPADLLDAAVARAEAFAAIPAASFTMTKVALRADASRLMAGGSIDEIIDAWTSPPVREAITAYLTRLANRA